MAGVCRIAGVDAGGKAVYSRFRDRAGNVSSVCSDTITMDTIQPTGNVGINNGAVYATSITVTLSLSATDRGADVGQMAISNGSDFAGAAWRAFITSTPWDLASGIGTKTVYAKFQDLAGNISPTYSDTIMMPARVYLPVVTKSP